MSPAGDGFSGRRTSNYPDVNTSFWKSHAFVPAVAFAAAFVIIEALDLDRRISHAWFHDAGSGTWLGQGEGRWWAKDLLHSGGRWFVRAAALAALVSWSLSFRIGSFRRFRRPAAFAFLALLASTALVGGLKAVTNVDCPWDLAEFGGDRPFVELLADRPDFLPRARCFPGAHASSGFALMFGYFVLRDRSRHAARLALGAAVLTGVLFSVGQEARGAHFISHDLASAVIVWFVQLILYRFMLEPRASPTEAVAPRRLTAHVPDAAATVPPCHPLPGNGVGHVAFRRRGRDGAQADTAEREHPHGSG